MDDIKDPVVTIRRKDLDNFQGQSTRSTRWFNIDREWLKEKNSTLEPNFYIKLFWMNIEGQYIETYQTFVVPLDNTKFTEKLNPKICNDSVTPNKKVKKRGIIWRMKKQLRIQNHQVIRKKKQRRK